MAAAQDGLRSHDELGSADALLWLHQLRTRIPERTGSGRSGACTGSAGEAPREQHLGERRADQAQHYAPHLRRHRGDGFLDLPFRILLTPGLQTTYTSTLLYSNIRACCICVSKCSAQHKLCQQGSTTNSSVPLGGGWQQSRQVPGWALPPWR